MLIFFFFLFFGRCRASCAGEARGDIRETACDHEDDPQVLGGCVDESPSAVVPASASDGPARADLSRGLVGVEGPEGAQMLHN